jgi:hypothetical protein
VEQRVRKHSSMQGAQWQHGRGWRLKGKKERMRSSENTINTGLSTVQKCCLTREGLGIFIAYQTWEGSLFFLAFLNG